jgi:type VI secretion system secreted protein Hcp
MAVDAFLKVDNIQGESQDKSFSNQIEVLSFSWGATQSAHIAGGGLSAGKPTLSDLSIMKHYDKSSPKLFIALVTGQHIPSIVLSLRKVGGGTTGGYVYLVYTLTNAICTGSQVSGGTEVATETITFAYQKVQVEYSLQQTSGAVASTGSVFYDLATHSTS